MSIKKVTVEDLWPGDVIIARQPGSYMGSPHRVSFTEKVEAAPDLEYARIHLTSRNGVEFIVPAPWSTAVELVS